MMTESSAGSPVPPEAYQCLQIITNNVSRDSSNHYREDAEPAFLARLRYLKLRTPVQYMAIDNGMSGDTLLLESEDDDLDERGDEKQYTG